MTKPHHLPLRLLMTALMASVLLPSSRAMAGTSSFPNLLVNPSIIPLIVPLFDLPWKCKTADLTPCASGDLANGNLRTVVILPTGFAGTESDAYWTDFDRTVTLITSAGSAGTSWSVQKRDQLRFVGYFIPSTPIGAPDALFSAKIPPHPIRGFALSLDQDAVYQKIADIQSGDLPALRPLSVIVMFNSLQDLQITANAAPPSFVNKPFGVAKMTRADLNQRGAYVPAHELAHAGLDYLDEYVEGGFENLSIYSVDVLTPLAQLDGTWTGFWEAIANFFHVYDMRISDILANNGNDNISTTRFPATVSTAGFGSEDYAYEGGMFFGRGTWHMPGSNLMNSGNVERGPGDAFAFAHSPSQQRVIGEAFGGPASRPNDRLRAAGPTNGWPAVFGSTTNVMLFDGDKLNHFHPTRTYTVQVAWKEREWHTCWEGPFPYPCSDDVWKYAQTTVWAARRQIELKMTAAYGLAKLAQGVMCAVGVTQVQSGDKTIKLCDANLDTTANEFLPTVAFGLPYQEVSVPASQWLTTYYWRFQTDNGNMVSGWTGWSSFYRSL